IELAWRESLDLLCPFRRHFIGLWILAFARRVGLAFGDRRFFVRLVGNRSIRSGPLRFCHGGLSLIDQVGYRVCARHYRRSECQTSSAVIEASRCRYVFERTSRFSADGARKRPKATP